MMSFYSLNKFYTNFIVKRLFLINIAKISSFLTNIGYSTIIIDIDLIGYVIVIRTPYIPLVSVSRNYNIHPPWIGMPLLLNIVVFSSAIFLNPSTNYVLRKITSFTLLRVQWLIVILTLFNGEWHDLVIWGIVPSKGVLHTSPFSIVLHMFL